MAAETAAEAEATAAAAEAAISLDYSLFASVTGEYMYYSADSDYLDSDGYYISPKFTSYALELIDADGLSSGELGIMYEIFTDEVYENQIVLYYTVSDSDFGLEYDSDYNQTSYSYDSDEELALQEKFGSSGDTEDFIEGFIDTLSIMVATAAVNAEYTFKKVKYDVLDYDDLSSFKEDEEAQATSVTTTFVSEAY
jgi:hypothetical protein